MVAAFAAVLALAPTAAAFQGREALDKAALALEASPVYVDPDARSALSASDAGRIRREIESHHAGPMYVAVLPSSAADAAGGDASSVVREIAQTLNRPGTYAVIVGRSFRAGATEGILPKGKAGALATEAFNRHHSQGAAATLLDFADRVGDARQGGSGGVSGSGGSGAGDSGGGGWIWAVLAAIGLGGFALRRRNKRRREREELEAVKHVARDDLVALGDEIRALDLDVQMPGANAEAKEHYNAAVEAYQSAEERFERARSAGELRPVSQELERGRYEMTAAQAVLEGKPVPERRAPCFFDPRHGPSTRDVDWAPAGGQPRPVPACEADAQRVEGGADPRIREVDGAPYWSAGRAYSPWFGGYWGGFGGGGFLPGLLIGEMLGGGFGGWSDPAYGAGPGDSGDGGDFGDPGDLGGDFGGGGDLGGGDFGGGDFGGGGGDF